MTKATMGSLLGSLAVLSAGTIGGAAMTWDLVGDDASLSFLRFGATVESAIFLCQAILYSRARNALFHQLLYVGSFGLTMAWFMLCLFLPAFWLDAIDLPVILVMAGIFLFIASGNFIFGYRRLHEKWQRAGAAAFEKRFNPAKKSVDWDKVVREMKITLVVHVPGVPQSLTPALSVFIFVALATGLILLSSHPVFSVVLLGISWYTMVSFFLQMSGYHVGQARKVAMIEKARGITLTSTD